MAIDPATAKLLAKLALQAVTDEETRKKIIITALIPIIVVLLILTLFVYIMTSPLSFLMNFFKDDSNKIAVEQYKTQYSDKVKLQKGTLVFYGKYPMPAAGVIASPYGMRTHPITGKYAIHTGVDLGTTWHCSVLSVADGQVAKTGIDKGYGNYIIIKHELTEESFYSVYAHLSTIYVLPDQEIKQGDIIGLEGGDPDKDILSGLSTGHHLHFEIRTGIDPSTHVDPIPYLYKPEKEKEKNQNEKEIVN